MNIALYFGSFNPIHKGHLAIAEAIFGCESIDKLWLVVSPSNPLKDISILANENDRLQMAKDAIEAMGYSEKVEVCDVEFSMARPSYTIDTLTLLAERFPQHSFSVVMGGDNIVDIEKWKDYQRLLDNYTIFVYPREGFERVDLASVHYLDGVRLYPLSSTAVRGGDISQNNDILECTKEYIIKNWLYESRD